MNQNIVGKNIRHLREVAKFTQESLAEFLDVDQSLISKIEKGERVLSSDMLEKIATLFGVSPEQIENESSIVPKLSFAFRGNELTVSEMKAISAINKIALNSEFMSVLLEDAKE